jgi:pimeloyl-ACP methyl ester carboxylesterase
VAGSSSGDLRPWPGEPESLVVTVDTGDRLHYLDWGGPTLGWSPLPPLLLIHGLAATAWSWAAVARRLRNVTRVLAPDLRGHGLSESPRAGYDLESLAYDALTVLTANGLGADAGGPPAAVAGHGLGALVAVSMAAIQPSSVAAVALVDAGWEDLDEATGMDAAEFERSIGDPPEVLASMDAYLADRREFDPPSWDADQERAARSAVDETHAGHVAPVVRAHAMRGSVEAMFDYRPREALARVTAPLLIAVAESGAADDETIRERRIALEDVTRSRAGAGLPAPEIRRFTGAGHNLMRYRPGELSAALRALLDAAGGARG